MKVTEILSEVSLKGFGDYAKKAQMDKALSQMGSAFAASPEEREKNLAKAKRREKGLARHKTRVDKYWAEKNAKDAAEREQAIRDKYAGVDIDAEIAKLQPALKRAYHDYQYGARNTYSQAHDEYNRISAKIHELERAKKVLGETATAGSTSAGNIATVTSPHLAIGKDRGNKSYTGSPGQSGTKAPKVPKTVQKKNPDGTAKNALDMPNNIFGGGAVKR
jgi:hypothetical protein